MKKTKIYSDSFKKYLSKLFETYKEKTKGKSKKQISKIWENYRNTKRKKIEKRKITIYADTKKVVSKKTFFSEDKKSKRKTETGFRESFVIKHSKRLVDNESKFNAFIEWLLKSYKHIENVSYIQPIVQYDDELWSGLHPIFSDVFTVEALKLFKEQGKNIFSLFLQKSDFRNKKSDFEIDKVTFFGFNIFVNTTKRNENIKTNLPKKNKDV